VALPVVRLGSGAGALTEGAVVLMPDAVGHLEAAERTTIVHMRSGAQHTIPLTLPEVCARLRMTGGVVAARILRLEPARLPVLPLLPPEPEGEVVEASQPTDQDLAASPANTAHAKRRATKRGAA